MATYEEIRGRWEARRAEAQRLDSMVSLAAICDDVIACLGELLAGLRDETLTRDQAAEVMGVHPDSVTRLLRKGKLKNVGTSSRPRFKRAELLERSAHPTRSCRQVADVLHSRSGRKVLPLPSSGGDAIARDVIAGRLGRRTEPPKSA